MLICLVYLAQVGNDVSVVGVCHIIACTLRKENLRVHFDNVLLPHVHPYSRLNEGLPVCLYRPMLCCAKSFALVQLVPQHASVFTSDVLQLFAFCRQLVN
jgi:hypothetical protein